VTQVAAEAERLVALEQDTSSHDSSHTTPLTHRKPLRKSLGCTSAALRLHFGCISAALRLHFGCTSALSRLYLEQDCNTGVDAACDVLAREDEAKRAWLAKLDVPAWGAAAKAVTAVAVQVAPGGVLDAPAWTPPATAAEISVQATANKQEMRGRTWGDHQVY